MHGKTPIEFAYRYRLPRMKCRITALITKRGYQTIAISFPFFVTLQLKPHWFYAVVSNTAECKCLCFLRSSGYGPPHDRTITERELKSVSTALFAFMTAVAVLGIILGITFLLINFLYRERRYSWSRKDAFLVRQRVLENLTDKAPNTIRYLNFITLKDGAYYCYCVYVLRISRYSGFLWVMLTNTGIFLRGLKLSGESRS